MTHRLRSQLRVRFNCIPRKEPPHPPDVQDLPDLLFAVWLSRNDQQPIKQVNGNAVRGPGAQHSTARRTTPHDLLSYNQPNVTVTCTVPAMDALCTHLALVWRLCMTLWPKLLHLAQTQPAMPMIFEATLPYNGHCYCCCEMVQNLPEHPPPDTIVAHL